MSDDCDTEGHVWEVGDDSRITKCTFCGTRPDDGDEEQLDIEEAIAAKAGQ